MKYFFCITLLLLVINSLYAQVDSTKLLNALEVKAQQSETNGVSRLRGVEGVRVFEAKKSEVVVLQDQSLNAATNNARQVFAKVTGLNIWESDGAGLQLGIGGRGLSPNRTSNFNTRQNGYDISADALGYPESYYTPPTESLDKIEVVRGAASLQYGTQFGGMLNFIMKQPNPNDDTPLSPESSRDVATLHILTRQTVGSWGFFGSYNQVSGKVGKWSYLGFYQHKQGNGWRPNGRFKLNNAYLDVHYHPNENTEIGLELTKMTYLAQQSGGLTDVLFEQNARQSVRARNWFKVDWNLACLAIDTRLGERTRLSSKTFGLLAQRQSLGVLSPINVIDFGKIRDLISGDFRNMGNETRLLHRYDVPILRGVSQTLAVGFRAYKGITTAQQGDAADGTGSTANFNFNDPTNVEKSDFTFPNYNFAFFAENIIRLNNAWSITPGVRFENIQTFADGYYRQRVFDAAGNIVVDKRINEKLDDRKRNFMLGGIGVSFKQNKFELYGNISQNYRAINFSDLRIDNPNAKVDSNLTDERGFTADLGIRTPAGKAFFGEITAFYIAYKNRIGLLLKTDPVLFNDFRLRTNIADARNMGIEAFGEYNFWQILRPNDSLTRLTLFANLSFIDARYINTQDNAIKNKQVELVPHFTLRTGLGFKHKKLKINAIWAYTAEHFTDATNAVRTASAVNGLIPAYHVADISASWSWRFLSVEASCNNVSNAQYFTRRADAYPGPGIIPSDGRGFYVTVGVQF
jgi:Fe(3+) dicitrate transport protein